MTEEAKNEEVKAEEAVKNEDAKTPETPETTEAAETPEAGKAPAQAEPPKKNRMVMRTLLLALLVVAAAFAIKHHMMVNDFNKAVQKIEAGQYKEASDMLVVLVERSYGQTQKRAKEELIKCFVALGENPENNIEETKKYYKKALEVDPNCLSPTQMKVVDPTYKLPKPKIEDLEKEAKDTADQAVDAAKDAAKAVAPPK
jgi:tetratricopeptide (TPR) repeat protein